MKKWAGILQEAAASGLPKVTWCEQNGINRRQFFHWQKKIREFVLEQHPELGLSVPVFSTGPQVLPLSEDHVVTRPPKRLRARAWSFPLP